MQRSAVREPSSGAILGCQDGSWDLLTTFGERLARWRGGDWCCLGWRFVRNLLRQPIGASSQCGQWFFLNENGYPVSLCAFSRRARLLAALDQTGALQIWDLERLSLQAVCQKVKDVRELAFTGDGKVLMGAVPGGICRWDVKDGSGSGVLGPLVSLEARSDATAWELGSHHAFGLDRSYSGARR